MPVFDVQWQDATRGLQRLRVQASDAQAVPAVLGVDAAQLVRLRPLPDRAGAGRRTDAESLRHFSQDLGLLLAAGIPVLEALQTLRDQSGGDALQPACDALQQGQALSTALATPPTHFDPLFLALVGAAERTGQLPVMLAQHAAYLAWTTALRRQVAAASVYPLLLLLAGTGVLAFLLLYVLPRFAGIFQGMGQDLPAASAALLRLGGWAGQHPQASVAALALLPVAAWAAWRWLRARPGSALLLWRLPLLGPKLRVLALARLYRGLGLLLQAGLALTTALPLLMGVLPAALRPALQRTLEGVQAGQRLSQALQAQGLATPVAERMLRVGEGSGQTATMLQRAAAFHDDEASRLADLVARTLNPALMLLIGGVIGTVVVLMYLPLFSLMEAVG